MMATMQAKHAVRDAVRQLLVMVCLAGAITSCSTVAAPSGDVKKEVVRVLQENPDLVLEALAQNDSALLALIQGASVREQARAQRAQRLKEFNNPFKPALEPARPVRGPSSAPITIVEYVDFECPFCARAAKTVASILARYPGQVRFILKHLPLEFHAAAMPAALYFEAIARQDVEAAWKFHDRVFAEHARLREGELLLKEIVASLQLDWTRFEQDLVSETVKAQIEQDKQEAFVFGFTGTPIFLINGVSLRGAYPEQDFAEIIQMTLSDPGIQQRGN
jgi:protein-disulfide isomerase